MKILTVILLLVFGNAVYSQNTILKGNTIPMVGYWYKGAQKHITYTKVDSKIVKGKPVSETTVVNALWQIKDSTDKHYVIYYTYKNFIFSNPKDSLAIAYAELFKGITVKYRTNELGMFDTILNLNEIIDISNKGLSGVFKKLNWPDNEVTRAVSKNMKQLFNNPTLLRTSISEEMVLIHYFYGLEYKLNTAYTYDCYLENTFGGEPYPGKAVYKLTALNTVNNRCKIAATITPVEKDFKRILYETMVGISESMQIPKPKKSDFETASIQHKCEAEYSIAEGWPLKISFTKISIINDRKSTSVTTISITD
ncbi:MAG: hypothetical protein PSX81_01895 [bacterium]|nr:hypothetical protein [bacterium]